MKTDELVLDAAVATDMRQTAGAAELMRTLLDVPRAVSPTAVLPSVVIGELVGIADGQALVRVQLTPGGRSELLNARTIVALDSSRLKSQVTLAFENGQADRPIITGVLQACSQPADPPVHIVADGKSLAVSADEQLVLRCGKASLTLTRAGKVLIRGEYVSTHSAGLTRIRGGAIQLN